MREIFKTKANARRSLRRVAPLAALLVALGFRIGSAKDEEYFSLSRLSVADRVLKVITDDLDNDGLRDIIIIHGKGLHPNETRWISVFWHKRNGSFSLAADQSWEIDAAAAIVDIGDVAGDAKREIVYVTSKDVRYYSIKDGAFDIRPAVLFAAKNIFAFPAKINIAHMNFVRDWNDDGRDDVALYLLDGISVYSRNGDGAYAAGEVLPFQFKIEMSGNESDSQPERAAAATMHCHLPALQYIDFDGDGRKDIVVSVDEALTVFRRMGQGTYSPKHIRRASFDLRTQKEKIDNSGTIRVNVADINGDGYADAFATKQVLHGLTNIRAAINVFMGGPDGYKAVPDQVIISEGSAAMDAVIIDVNGDKRLDLVVPSFKLSIMAIIRILTTKSLPIYFNIFLLHGDGTYSNRPDFVKEVKFNIDFSGDTDMQAMDFDGDFNGDGHRDFAAATREKELSVFLGTGGQDGELYSKKAAAKIPANAFGYLSSPDLNGDGYADMIIHYRSNRERRGSVEVLMNLKKLR